MKGVAAFVALSAAEAAVLRGQNRLQAGMQPEMVAKTLKKVEDDWRNEAVAFAECNASQGEDCAGSSTRFVESCTTLVGAVVQASSGDRSVVKEYMGDICGEPVLNGWHQGGCNVFATALVSSMGIDSFTNREEVNSQALCKGLWARFSVEQKALVEKERAEHEKEEERNAAEEKVKQEAEKRERMEKEAAEQKKAAEELAAAAAKQKAEEEAAAKLAAEQAAAKAAAEQAAEEQAAANASQAQSTENATVVLSNTTAAVENVTVETPVDKPVETNVTAMADQIAAVAEAPNMTNATIVDTPVVDTPVLVSNASTVIESNSTSNASSASTNASAADIYQPVNATASAQLA